MTCGADQGSGNTTDRAHSGSPLDECDAYE